jgi:hypothetical protein
MIMRFGVSSLFWMAFLTTAVRADLDPQLNQPYELQVVLRFAKHRLHTEVFRGTVERELGDSLQAAFGPAARVKIVTDHPRLEEADKSNLQALETWHFLDGVKLHFVLVDFVDGYYEIRARQYDGTCGMASPLVRLNRTADRQLVARRAALLINQDFGEIGTVQQVDGDKVELALKAGLLGDAISRRIGKDDLFAIAQIVNKGGTGEQALRIDWTLLQVRQPAEQGRCSCLLLHRRENALGPVYGLEGHRCIKLGTTEGPLRVRVTSDDKLLPVPLNGRQVLFRDEGFAADIVERRSTNADGLVQPDHRFRRIAFVQIFDGSTALTQVPVPILDERTVSIPVSAHIEGEQRSQLMVERDRWKSRVYEALDIAANLVKDLNSLVEQSRDAALTRARSGLKTIQAEAAGLAEERAALQKKAEGAPIDLAEGDQRLEELQSRRQELEKYIAALGDIVGKEKDPTRIKWRELAAKGRLLESQAEYGEAIDAYERVFAAGGDDSALKEHLEALREAWKVRDGAHREARDFIYNRWSKLTRSSDLRASMRRARAAFETCRSAGDTLTPNKLMRINLAHSSRLEKEIESLRPQEFEDDRKTAETILSVADDLKNLNDDARHFLSTAKPITK